MVINDGFSSEKNSEASEANTRHWFSVQIKPVGSLCNLNCKYCYVKPWLNSQETVMSFETLEHLVSKCLMSYSYPTFSWHGGEPTLAGYGFFEKAMNLMDIYKKPEQEVRNLIQTNATRITTSFATLFKKYHFGVSVSLDGPENIHGLNRIKKSGSNSFAQVMQGIGILRKAEIDPSVICTVSKETLPFASEVFNFLIDQRFRRIKYSPVFDSLKDEFSITGEEWFDYLKIILHLWLERKDPTIQVRDLDEVIVWLSRESLKLCESDRTCLHWVSVNPKGEIYPCEYLRNQFYYGNITQMALEDVYDSNTFQRFKEIYETIPIECQSCDFFEVCGNGCPATRVKKGKIALDGIYAFCETRKKLFREVQTVFGEALEGGDQDD